MLSVLAALVVGAIAFGLIDGQRGYEATNARLVREAEPLVADRGPVWRVTFDVKWSAFGHLPVQTQPCTVRLLAGDGTVLAERGFGLHVGKSDRGVSPPFEFPVSSLPADPDRAEVVCSRRG